MSYDIINEIRKMEQNYYAHYGKRGEIICLDANAEAKLAAYYVLEFSGNEYFFTCITDNDKADIINDILKYGIRHLGITIVGMKLEFDCPSFCIKNKDINKKFALRCDKCHNNLYLGSCPYCCRP